MEGISKEKKMSVKVVCNYATEFKLFFISLLILCTLGTFFQLIPTRFTTSASDLRLCITKLGSEPNPDLIQLNNTNPPQPLIQQQDRVLSNGVIKRAFNPYGASAYNFIIMSSYRGGLKTFAIIGLASKPLHVYGKPTYQCEWVSNDQPNSTKSISTIGYKILPDWGYGRVYTVVIVNCTFSETINGENSGGKLILYASTSGGGDRNFNVTVKIEAIEELPGSLKASLFDSKPKYDYLYCGSPLYGNLSPQRVREWLAYHVRFFGNRSHFVIYDAGGVHEEVMKVLKPWIELGYVTLQDVREQKRFDGYYHNHFMVVK